MSELVERVARAIWNADIAVAGNQPISDMSWDEMWSSRRRELLEPPARVAIAAMREPTEAMIEAGYERLCNGELPTGPYHWEGWITPQVFRDMIDAALK